LLKGPSLEKGPLTGKAYIGRRLAVFDDSFQEAEDFGSDCADLDEQPISALDAAARKSGPTLQAAPELAECRLNAKLR
jgi:hypothetical protein